MLTVFFKALDFTNAAGSFASCIARINGTGVAIIAGLCVNTAGRVLAMFRGTGVQVITIYRNCMATVVAVWNAIIKGAYVCVIAIHIGVAACTILADVIRADVAIIALGRCLAASGCSQRSERAFARAGVAVVFGAGIAVGTQLRRAYAARCSSAHIVGAGIAVVANRGRIFAYAKGAVIIGAGIIVHALRN